MIGPFRRRLASILTPLVGVAVAGAVAYAFVVRPISDSLGVNRTSLMHEFPNGRDPGPTFQKSDPKFNNKVFSDYEISAALETDAEGKPVFDGGRKVYDFQHQNMPLESMAVDETVHLKIDANGACSWSMKTVSLQAGKPLEIINDGEIPYKLVLETGKTEDNPSGQFPLSDGDPDLESARWNSQWNTYSDDIRDENYIGEGHPWNGIDPIALSVDDEVTVKIGCLPANIPQGTSGSLEIVTAQPSYFHRIWNSF